MLLHVDIIVHDMERMLSFYCQNLGLKKVEDVVVKGEAPIFLSNRCYNEYRLVLLKNHYSYTMIELLQFLPKSDTNMASTNVTLTFWTPSLAKKAEELSHKGVYPVSNEIGVSLPAIGSSIIQFYRDPENNLVEFLEMKGEKNESTSKH